MAIIAKFTRTLPAPTATISGGFVFLLSAAWFTQSDQGAAGSPIDGGVNSLANGGGDLQVFSDTAATTRLPIDVVTFVTGVSSIAQVWVRTTSYTSGDTVTIGKNDTQIAQPAFGAAFGRDATWSDNLYASHEGLVDVSGNTTPTQTGTALVSDRFGNASGARRYNSTSNDKIYATINGGVGYPHTIELWAKVDTTGDTRIMSTGNSASTANQTLLVTNFSGGFAVRELEQGASFGGYTGSAPDRATGIWRKYVYVLVSATERYVYLNGVLVITGTGTASVSGQNRVALGVSADLTPFGTQPMDISNPGYVDFAKTDDHILSEYNNQSDPDNFGTSSEWVLVGGGGITLTVDASIASPVFSVQSSITSPAISSNASLEIIKPEFSSSVSVTLPNPGSNIDLLIASPLFGVSVDVTLPSAVSSVSFDVSKPVFSADASVTLPNPVSVLDINIQAPVFSASMAITDPSTSSNIDLTISGPIFNAESSVTLPQPLSSVQFSISKPAFSASISVSGLDIIVGDNAKLTVSFESNKITLETQSNYLKV